MKQSAASSIKKERRKSFFLREIAKLIQEIAIDESILLSIFPTRVEFSEGEGTCFVYFSCPGGETEYLKALEVLKLYKPSIRKVLAKIRPSKYVPEIRFEYDQEIEEARRMEDILDRIKVETEQEDEKNNKEN